MSASQADKYAAHSRPDKVRFAYRGLDPLEAHKVWSQLLEGVMQMHGWSEGYAKRHVKYEPLYHKSERVGAIFQLTYRAAEYAYQLNLSWLPRVTEVESKTYLNEREPGMYDAFLDAVQNAEGGRLAAHVYYPGAHSSPKKGKTHRKLDLGSRKSDNNVKCYKRPGERPGLEVVTRKKAVKKIAADVREYTHDIIPEGEQGKVWHIFFLRCARHGFRVLVAELHKRGVELADYFSDYTAVEDESWECPSDESTTVEPIFITTSRVLRAPAE